ncbi:hypothetical protein [Thermus caliditerrae]|uniref:hypothetical protein n=1 Tax=Thermus caliditerrae TaxID=1330700 RepID=UPI00056F0A64|nr:hypothetical protein [Thermus caliditerrae]
MVYLLDLSGVYCYPVEPLLLRLLAEASGEPLFYLSQAFYDLLPRLKAEGPGVLEALFPGASRLYPKAFRPRAYPFPEPFHLVADLPPPEGYQAFFHPEKVEALALALGALGLAPEEALYLDDNPLLVAKARALGFRAEVFRP